MIYEYGIARMRQSDFDKLDKSEYLAARKRGLQLEVLVGNKSQFSREYPDVVIDNATIDEILPLLTKEEHELVFRLGCFIFSIVLFAVSYMLSLFLYKRKEL